MHRDRVLLGSAALVGVVAVIASGPPLPVLGGVAAVVWCGWLSSRPDRLSWARLLVAHLPLMPIGIAATDPLLVAARMSVGATAVAWFARSIPWPMLASRLREIGLRSPVDFVDSGYAHGLRLATGLVDARDVARVRLGRPERLREAADVLAMGIVRGVDRGVRVEEAKDLRSASAGPGRHGPHGLVDATVVAGDGVVLDRIDLSVDPGEWLVVAGPSGSGKTTLLRTLAGLTALSGGELVRFGRGVEGPLRRRLDGAVAYVPQDPDDHLVASTPIDDVAWALVRRGWTELHARRAAAEMLERLGVGGCAHRPVDRCSFGERRRVCLAGALATGPLLLLCDEPTAGLDPVAASSLVRVIEESAASTETSVVWVTHDLQALPRLAQRVLLLNRGRVVVDAPREQALTPEWLTRAGLLSPSLDPQELP